MFFVVVVLVALGAVLRSSVCRARVRLLILETSLIFNCEFVSRSAARI